MTTYHYRECGLDNVYIEGLNIVEDHASEKTVTIPAIGLLHKVIAEGIVDSGTKISGKELKFLRTEMGLTQSKLADIVKVTLLTVGRWERDESSINDAAEMLIRKLAIEKLNLDIKLSIDQISEKVIQGANTLPIRINGNDPKNYQRLAA